MSECPDCGKVRVPHGNYWLCVNCDTLFLRVVIIDKDE